MNKWLSRILFGLFALCGMFLVSFLSYQGHWAIALGFAVFLFISLIIFAKKNAYPLRFMYPGLITFFLFLVLPIVFTVLIGFTNLGTGHLLSKGTVKDIIASETVEAQEGKAKNLAYLVIEEGSRYDIYAHDDQTNKNYKSSFTLGNKLIKLEEFSGTMPEEGMAKGKLFQLFKKFKEIPLILPEGEKLSFGRIDSLVNVQDRFQILNDGRFEDMRTKVTYKADDSIGFYVSEQDPSDKLSPGYYVTVGLQNFTRLFSDSSIRESFTQIFFALGFGLSFLKFFYGDDSCFAGEQKSS